MSTVLPGARLNTANNIYRDEMRADTDSVKAMCLQILIQQGLTAILTNLVITALTAAVLYPQVSQTFVLSWFFVAMMVNGSRLFLWRSLRRQLTEIPSMTALRQYENSYAAALFVSGATWGALALVFSNQLPMTQQIAIPLILAGMSAGAVFSHLSSLRSFCAFVWPMILPVSVSLFLAGLEIVALTTVVYLVAITILSRNLNKKMLESLLLRNENQALVNHLSEINQAQSALLQELQAKETFLLHTFEDAGVPMLLIDKELQILDVNKSGCVLFGYDKAALQQQRIVDLLHPDDASDISPQFDKLMQGDIEQYRVTRRCLGEQGKTLWLNATISAVRNHKGEIDYVVIQAQDITEQYLLSEDLNYQSLHDAMTGLPNRRALEKQLQHMLAQPTEQAHAFCYLDLDQFKVINDTCGHIAGDALLKQMTALLQVDLHEHDFVARFSGDEFAILLASCSQQQACQRLEQLLARIRDFDFVYEGYSFKVSACVGLVMFDHHSTIVELLKQADSACYAAKEAGRDRFHLFSETDTELVQRNGEMRWVTRIQQALNDNRMVLYSQPIVPSLSHKTSLPHVELLIRMLDDDGSIISPGEFLPAAERYNLVAAIDMWTVEHVLLQLQQAREQGRDIHGIYGINLSGQSLGDARFYKRIISLIKAAGLTDSRAVLCFEVTETAAITNMRSALHFINELRQIGCLIALDDFGSGLSSFAYLKQMPIDYLKIDGMFVNDCVHNSVNLEIVNSINGIGQVLGLKTVAEFVEDESTLITMKHLGVDFVQGFRIGKPQPWEI